MILLTSKEANEILRTAVRCSKEKIYTIAEKANIEKASLYHWSSEQRCLNAKNYDRLIEYFKQYEAATLELAFALNGYTFIE